MLGFDHAEVGAALLQHWGLAELQIEAARAHHEPSNASPSTRDGVDLVHIAEITATALHIGSSGEMLVSALDADAWRRSGLDTTDLAEVVTPLDDQVELIRSAWT